MKYVTRAWFPEGEWQYAEESADRSITVQDQGGSPIDTGLYDATGTKLFRVPERVKFGFSK